METCRPFSFQRLSLLGAEVDIVTPEQVLEFVAARARSGRRTVIANHNLHSLHLFARDAAVRDFYARADLIEIDSTPLIAWGRLMGQNVSSALRSTYLDFRNDFWDLVTAMGLSVYHLGGAPGVGKAARDTILSCWPNANLVERDGYFDVDGPANDMIIAELNARRPDILLVGMGMPRQELWIADNLDRLPPCVIMPVGGAFDYEAGVQYAPPRWTGRLGIEWLVRCAANPKRLFSRYFIEPWSLIPQMLDDVVWSLSRRERLSTRIFSDEVSPWRRRQALSTLVPVPDSVVAAEPAGEMVPEQLRAAN